MINGWWNVNIDRVNFLRITVHIFNYSVTYKIFCLYACCLLCIVCYVPLKRELLNCRIELSAYLIPAATWNEVEGDFFPRELLRMLFLGNIALCRVGEKRCGFHPDSNLIFTEPIVMNSIKSNLSNHEPKIYHCYTRISLI